VRGDWRAVIAVVVAPEGLVDVVMVRGCEGEGPGEVCACCVVGEGDGVALPCWMAECALKAARKFEKKGR
jgi:hypothetical protein